MSEVTNPIAEFPDEIRQAVDGLLHLGYLESDVEFAGHTFGLRTLRVDEELAAAKAMDPFRNTLREPEAWICAQVGLSLTHVDGDDTFCPPAGPDKSAFARARFQYITSKWFMPTIEFLFTEYTLLLRQQQEAILAVQGLSFRSRPTSLPSAASLKEPGISGAPINLETLG